VSPRLWGTPQVYPIDRWCFASHACGERQIAFGGIFLQGRFKGLREAIEELAQGHLRRLCSLRDGLGKGDSVRSTRSAFIGRLNVSLWRSRSARSGQAALGKMDSWGKVGVETALCFRRRRDPRRPGENPNGPHALCASRSLVHHTGEIWSLETAAGLEQPLFSVPPGWP